MPYTPVKPSLYVPARAQFSRQVERSSPTHIIAYLQFEIVVYIVPL